MNKLLIGLFSAGLLTSGLAQATETTAQPWTMQEWNDTLQAMPTGDAERGKNLHRNALCMSCHGESGVAPTRNTPSLASQPKAYIYKTLIDYRSGLRNEGDGKSKLMQVAAFPMSNQDIADLATYYESQELPIRKNIAVDESIETLVKQGDMSRMVVSCAACHGAKGEGMGATPALAGQTRDYFVRTMQNFKANARANDINQGMAQFTYKLTDDEILGLADYYASLKGE